MISFCKYFVKLFFVLFRFGNKSECVLQIKKQILTFAE